MEFPLVSYETKNNVATITFNHPETYNAVSDEMLDGLLQAFSQLKSDVKNKSARCLVITGSGNKAFCAGANLTGRGSNKPSVADRDAGSALETAYHPVMRKIRDLPIPTLASVNGVAAGIGVAFAAAPDIAVAAESARFILAFRRIGLVPDGGSTWILPRIVGMARAKEMALLGEDVSAQKALEWGLVSRVVPDDKLADETQKVAQKLAQGPTVALGLIRDLFWNSHHNSYEEQLDMEKRLQGVAGETKDFKEGVAAFREKRQAKFSGELPPR